MREMIMGYQFSNKEVFDNFDKSWYGGVVG